MEGRKRRDSGQRRFLKLSHQSKAQNAKTGSTSQLFWGSRMCFLVLILRKMGFELFTVQSKGFTRLLQALLNSDSHGDGHTDHGRAMQRIADRNTRNLPVAGCHLTHGSENVPNLLLQRFFDRNCDRHSHTDHGVVASAQEASEARFRGGI